MSAPRRVLLVSHRAVAGGAQRALAALALGLPECGWAPAMALGEDGWLAQHLRAAGVAVRIVAGENEPRWRAESPDAQAGIERVARAAADHGAEAVVGLCAEGHRLAGPAARTLSLPAVWWRMLTPRGRPYERAAAQIPAAAVACLAPGAMAAQRELMPDTPVELVPLGIDVAAAVARLGAGAALRARLAPGGQALVGIVGRLDPAKGQDDFLAAAARVANAHPSARFAVVGGALVGHEGDIEARLHAMARELGIHGRVTFAGHQEDPLPWFDALDVAVVASHHEAFGLVCLEALALGAPVVATATDGPAFIIRPEREGLLVPVGDPEALGASVSRLLGDAELRKRLGAAGPSRARDFDERATAERMAQLLGRVSAGPRAAAGSGGAPGARAAVA